MNTIKIGMIGFGTIGAGVAKILTENSEIIQKRLGARIELVKVADLDIVTDRGVKLAPDALTTSAEEVINHPDITVVIELMGGYEPARTFLLQAIDQGKHVVTANKALLAKHGDEIFSAITEKGLSIGFEASIGGAIPIIRSVREAFVANNIQSIEGIVNGTANYILSKMSDENCDFNTALKEAQEKGFAEADPTFDIEGIDSAHKIAVLTRLAYGTPVSFDDITVSGISNITSEDIECAREFGYRIKLLAISKFDGQAIDIRVHPAMIPIEHPMANVNGVLNAIRVCDDMMDENILIGHGAGALPTGSAVVGDVVEIARNILSGLGERIPAGSFQNDEIKNIPLKNISEIESEYFLRFSVLDKPGVLSKISGILGTHSISIESMIQRGRADGSEGVPLVMMCHKSSEKNIQSALKEIEQLDVVCGKSNLIRVEK
ncbi:MAG: homoserine dehydrogenase [Nitrospina sp.]|jgi:homoserine dehydrogenase|nr:homoserine dehydrogenase [Nitrospina sp.]MBT4828179.1 homoserine dehydrogenase [Candidatus Neomarinimicrobiota bacterium]